jgi:hypothetical protein
MNRKLKILDCGDLLFVDKESEIEEIESRIKKDNDKLGGI